MTQEMPIRRALQGSEAGLREQHERRKRHGDGCAVPVAEFSRRLTVATVGQAHLHGEKFWVAQIVSQAMPCFSLTATKTPTPIRLDPVARMFFLCPGLFIHC